MQTESQTQVQRLLERSHRLGSDPRNTNYAGGNTSCKAFAQDPSSGKETQLMWVKGSGGDLGTLTESGLAVLRLDKLKSLVNVYPGPEKEDEMVAAFDFCLFGKGGAAPSIDTAMHGLVECNHIDHLHPDSGIAFATAADGESLTKQCFGTKVAWVPWRRPGFQLGLDIAKIREQNKDAIGVILGGHGITAWGDTSEQCEANSLEIITTAREFITKNGRTYPIGQIMDDYSALDQSQRRDKAATLFPLIRSMASTDFRQVGHFNDSDIVLDFLSRSRHLELSAKGSSCPDHFLRTKIRPMVLDLGSSASISQIIQRLEQLHSQYRTDYENYYKRYAKPDSPPMRGADPAIVLIPGVGMFSFGRNKQTARVAGEFFINAINVMTGAESISEYVPIDEEEKFKIEYWELEEQKLKRMPPAKTLATQIAVVTGAGSGIGKATAERLVAEGANVVVADIDFDKAKTVAGQLGTSDVAIATRIDVSSADEIRKGIAEAVLAFGGVDILINNAGLSVSKSLVETTEKDWDLQHSVMAKGSFLCSQAAAKIMIDQKMGGNIIYIVSKNSIFAGPNNIAYGSAKADQAHQVRLLAAELGNYSIRVNGINPDGVVRNSGIFAGGWGAQRAAIYGVAEEELGSFYAGRTLLKKEVLPENVANAVFVLLSPDLSHTTGVHIPVDSGVSAAFLR